MQKIAFAFINTVLIATTVAYAAPSQQTLERTITGIHTKLFGVDNLYKSPLDAREWDEVMGITYDFVKEHRDAVEKLRNQNFKKKVFTFRSSTVKRNKELLKSYEKIKEANDELVKNIKAAYSELFESSMPKDVQLIEKFSKKFDAIHTKMQDLTKYLKKELDTIKTKIKNEESDTKKQMLKDQEQVVTVLHRLSLTIATTATKARNDLKK